MSDFPRCHAAGLLVIPASDHMPALVSWASIEQHPLRDIIHDGLRNQPTATDGAYVYDVEKILRRHATKH